MAHRRNYDPDNTILKQLRKICLALPDTFEKEAWGEATFRVDGGTMFAMSDWNHHDSGHIAVWVKAPPLAQAELIERDPERFFRPPYMGPKGWVGIRLDTGPDWNEVQKILKVGYDLSVPRKSPKSSRLSKKKSAKKSAKKKMSR